MVSQNDLASAQSENFTIQSRRYKILKKLGEGTYATVYLTELFEEDVKEVPRKLACKVVDTRKTPEDYLNKFLPRELSILRQLNHPDIIHIHSIHKKNYKYLIFMRFAERGDLLDFTIKNGAIIENQARMWSKQIALALQYLHELEIAHRDLKCENILITHNFNAKLADFGFSRFLVDKKGLSVLSETYCGSTSYSAPEILKGVPYNPKVADMWSLGVIIYVMLNKAMPFGEMALKKLYEYQVRKKWKFKTHTAHETSQEVKDLVKHLLEPNTHQRFTVTEVLNSDWMFMDPRIQGMTEEEGLALIKAKEARQKLEEDFFFSKNHVQ